MKKILFLISLLAIICFTFDAAASKAKPPGDNFGIEMVIKQNHTINQAIEIALPFDFSFNRFIVIRYLEQPYIMNAINYNAPKHINLVSQSMLIEYYFFNLNNTHYRQVKLTSKIYIGLSSGGKGL